jgi:Putative collagen-binding domain of a collagenase
MQVRRARGAVLSTLLGLAVLPSLVPGAPGFGLPAIDVVVDVPAAAGRLLLVRHAGTAPVVVDTTALTGPTLRGWWVDGVTGETVDAGSVPRGTAVALNPPDTGDASTRDWTLVIVDATRGLVPPV